MLIKRQFDKQIRLTFCELLKIDSFLFLTCCINILKNTSTSKHKINKKKVFRREKEILIAKFSYMNFVSFFFPPKVLYRWYCCLVLFYRWENWGLEMLNWAQGLATGKKQQGVQSLSLALTRRGDWPRGQCSLNGGTLSGTSIEAQVGRPSPASVSRVPWPQAAGLQGCSYQWRQPAALQNTESHVLTLPILSHSHEVCLRHSYGLCWWFSGKESACQCRTYRFDLWVGKIPWRRQRQPTPVFLPGKPHQQRHLVGYSPWGCKRVRLNLAT